MLKSNTDQPNITKQNNYVLQLFSLVLFFGLALAQRTVTKMVTKFLLVFNKLTVVKYFTRISFFRLVTGLVTSFNDI